MFIWTWQLGFFFGGEVILFLYFKHIIFNFLYDTKKPCVFYPGCTHLSIYLSVSVENKNINIITRIYSKYLNTATMYIVILNGNTVKNNPIQQGKSCNTRLTGYKFVNSNKNNHIFNFETLLFLLTLEFEKSFVNNKAVINM